MVSEATIITAANSRKCEVPFCPTIPSTFTTTRVHTLRTPPKMAGVVPSQGENHERLAAEPTRRVDGGCNPRDNIRICRRGVRAHHRARVRGSSPRVQGHLPGHAAATPGRF